MWNTSLYGASLVHGSTTVALPLGTKNEIAMPDIGLEALWRDDELIEPPKLGASVNNRAMRLNKRSRYSGLVVFQVDRSPYLTLDEAKTNFIYGSGLHYVVQRIPDESLPEYEELFTKAPYPNTRNRMIDRLYGAE